MILHRRFLMAVKLTLLVLFSLILSIDFSAAMILEGEDASSLGAQLLACFQNFGSTQMVMPLLIAGIVYFSEKLTHNMEHKRTIRLSVVSCIFGLLNTFGQQMYHNDHLFHSIPGQLLMTLYAASCAVIFYHVGRLFFYILPKLAYKNIPQTQSDKKLHILFFCVILAGWLPWMIAYYPFSADWDVYYPIQQYMGQAEKTMSFPWFYCSVIGFFYTLGQSLGSKNMGVFLYVLLRALAMAAIYSNLIVKLKNRGVKSCGLWGIVFFFALTPVWGAYAKHGFKDTLASALFCWYVTLTVDTVEAVRNREKSKKPYLLYTVSGLAVSLFRNNCIYIVIPVTLLLIAGVVRKLALLKWKVRVSAMIASGIILFGTYIGFISVVENVASGYIADAFSIPFQQTARTVRYHHDDIPQEQRDAIDGVFVFDKLPEKYDPLILDPVKTVIRPDKTNIAAYIKAWFSMLFQYPKDYIEAALGLSYGYYAFTGDQALHAGNWNCGMTIFNWVKDPRFDPAFTCDYIDGFQGLRNILEKWAEIWHHLPLLGLTDMKAVYTWIIVLIGVLIIRKGRMMDFIPIFACVLTILFCCGSPVNDCFRYFAPAAAASPACLLLVFPKAASGQDTRGRQTIVSAITRNCSIKKLPT